MTLSKVEKFVVEELDYGYYTAKPVGDFVDAFGNEYSIEVLFSLDKDGQIISYDVCETGIWGNIYWGKKTKTYPHNRVFIKKLQNQIYDNRNKEEVA